MRILMVGDVFGRPGRKFFCEVTKDLRREKNIDLVVINGENVAHGKSLTEATFTEVTAGGADIITSGNHIWDRRDIFELLEREPYLLRPANYPENTPGKGFCIYPHRTKNVGVINLIGRTYMQPVDCPFTKAAEILKTIKRDCDIILVDFHAEATSEKIALAYYLDGQVTAVVGTHTHVQTADERILPKGTAFITDLGMTGPVDSAIGIKVEPVIEKFITCRLTKFEIAESPCVYCAVIIDVDDKTNMPTKIERLQIYENDVK